MSRKPTKWQFSDDAIVTWCGIDFALTTLQYPVMGQSLNIAVAGAGVTGLCAAYLLLKARRHRVTLYDPGGFPAHNASALAGGMLAPYAEIEHMPEAWIPACLSGIAFWEDFSKHCAVGFHRRGSFITAHEADFYILERFLRHLPRGKQRLQKTCDLEMALAEKFPQGLFLSEEAHLTPALALAGLVEAIKEGGGIFVPEKTSPDKLVDRYDFVVDCRGLGAVEDGPEGGETLRGVKGELAVVRNEDLTLARPVRLMHPRYPLYIVPRADHVFMIGATEIEAAGSEQVSIRSGLELLSALYSLHSSFGEAQILGVHSGVRPAYADNLPRIGETDRLFSCNGLFRHGFLLAPVMGRCVAECIAGQESEFLTLFKGGQDDHRSYHQRAQKNVPSAA